MDKSNFEIQAKQQLSESDLTAIRGLEGLCNNHEGLHMRLNWDMLYERKPDETNDFMCFDSSGQLVGYLALYCFGRPEAEISGMVHPLHRHSGIFSKLLKRASDECRQRGIKSLLFICERNSSSGLAFVKAYHAGYDHSENKMEIPGDTEPLELHSSVILRPAGSEDFNMLARMDAISYGETEEESRVYYNEDHLISTDELFVSVLDGIDIGKVRLCKENEDVLIFGFVIQPEYRGKGYGRATLGRAVNAALEHKPKRVMLEVDCVNDTALSLYKSCGFKTLTTFDYYRLPL